MTVKFIFRTVGAIICFLFISTSVHAGHSWGPPYHWARTANPLPLKVIDSATSVWQGELDDSIFEWKYSNVLDLRVDSADDSNRTRKRCKSVTGQIRVCNAAYGFNGWLGMASININSEAHITKGTAKVNDSYSSYWDIPGEKNHVMCQEIGHLFGLGHTSTNGSSQGTCMDYSSDLSSQWPNRHDYDHLADIYAHLDSYNSFDDGAAESEPEPKACNPRSPKCSNFEGPEIPPMGVRVHKGLHHEIWVARGRADTLWIHHVRLVPEEYR